MDKLKSFLKSKHGNLTFLANSLGITPSAIAQWRQVPAERVPDISKLTGIPRHDLRPDLYEVSL